MAQQRLETVPAADCDITEAIRRTHRILNTIGGPTTRFSLDVDAIDIAY